MQAHTVARGPSPHSNQPSNYPTEQPRGQPAPRQLPPHELRQGPLCVTTAVVPHNRPATACEGGHPAQPPTTEQRETRGRLASKGARQTKPQTQTATDHKRTNPPTKTHNRNLISKEAWHLQTTHQGGSSKTKRSRQLPCTPPFPQGALPNRSNTFPTPLVRKLARGGTDGGKPQQGRFSTSLAVAPAHTPHPP
jgi:hypothetical protein